MRKNIINNNSIFYIESTTKIFSYNMLVVNYLYSLMGKKTENNKLSFNDGCDEKVNNFFKDNILLFNKLKKLRNKVYSHCDPNYEDYKFADMYDFYRKCIVFLVEYLNIDKNNIKFCYGLDLF